MRGVFCSTQYLGESSIVLAVGAPLIHPRFVWRSSRCSYWSAVEALFDGDGGNGVPTEAALSRDGPFYKEVCEPIYVLKPLPMSGVPNLPAG